MFSSFTKNENNRKNVLQDNGSYVTWLLEKNFISLGYMAICAVSEGHILAHSHTHSLTHSHTVILFHLNNERRLLHYAERERWGIKSNSKVFLCTHCFSCSCALSALYGTRFGYPRSGPALSFTYSRYNCVQAVLVSSFRVFAFPQEFLTFSKSV